jgi:nitrous oxidase accessory protein
MQKTGKVLAVLIAVIIISSIVILQLPTFKEQSKIIVVPDDYPTIQSAIDNASAGDTIYVKKGTYPSDAIVISKSVSLIGEATNETIIQGTYYYHGPLSLWHTIVIEASNVRICNFTITHCIIAVTVSPNASGTQIIGNNFIGINEMAITASEVSNLLISQNFFSNNRSRASTQISLFVNDSIISQNVFSNNLRCISLSGKNITVNDNQFGNNTFGVDISRASAVNVFANIFTKNNGYDGDSRDYGCIELVDNCNDTAIFKNLFSENTVGVNLRNFLIDSSERTTEPVYRGSNNVIFNNNFIGNSKNSNVEHEWIFANSTSLETYTSGTAVVFWDNDTIGNYWSDYNGNGSYAIDENNIDNHPLTQEVDVNSVTPIPTPSATTSRFNALPIAIITIVIIFALATSLLLFRRHQKTNTLNK